MPSIFDMLEEYERQPTPAMQPQAMQPQPMRVAPAQAAARRSIFDAMMESEGVPPPTYGGTTPTAEEGASVTGFLGNAASDISDIAGGVWQTVRHPIQTAQAVYDNPTALADPYIEQASDPLGYAYEKPVSSLLNLSVGTGVLGAAAKVGRVGKAADVLSKVSRATDPVNWAARGVGRLGTGGANLTTSTLGATTTAGRESVSAAAEAGFKGGAAAKAFRDNQLKRVPAEAVVTESQQALSNIRRGAKGKYNAEMAPVYADTAVQSFSQIRAGIDRARQIGSHTPPTGGKAVPFLPKTRGVVTAMNKVVTKWEKRGAKYHTLGGLNDMKRELGEFVTKYEKGTPERSAADEIYGSVKETIANMDPRYSQIMRDYDLAQDLIRDVSQTLSLKDKNMVDTGIRKLQSALRDTTPNAAGVRRQLVQALVDNGADNLIYKIAGQNLQTMVRPGLAAQLGAGLVIGGGVGGAINPAFALGLATISPRLVGSTAYRAGQAAKVVKPMIIAERAMRNKLGISGKQVGRVGGLMAASMGRLQEAQERSGELKAAVAGEQQKLGYNIHPRVLDSIVDKLLSDDPAEYMTGIDMLGGNKRLLKLFESMGTKGER